MDGANYGIAVRPAGHLWEVLADVDARDIGADRLKRPANRVGCVRLQIPRIQLAGAAHEEQEDAAEFARRSGSALEGAEVGQRQAHAARTQGPDAQEVAPCQTVAHPHTLLALELQHGSTLSRWRHAEEVRTSVVHPSRDGGRCNQKTAQ